MCHGDIVEKISGIKEYAKVCNNGKKELMKVPSGFKSPRENYQICSWEVKYRIKILPRCTNFSQGKFFCHNDEVSKQTSAAFPIRRVCVDGKVKVINDINGLAL